ncbi:hypothetical protein [Agrobacterium leguminum]
MSLDNTFGLCIQPDRTINDQERLHCPESVATLNDKTGAALKEYLLAALRMPQVAHSTSVILWVVDDKGEVRFALEELLNIKTGRLAAVRPRGDWGNLPGTLKLGHPSLVERQNKFARIGGEIVYNIDEERWEINNFSGRYGTRPKTTKAHLEAVAGIFRNYNIYLHVDFEVP